MQPNLPFGVSIDTDVSRHPVISVIDRQNKMDLKTVIISGLMTIIVMIFVVFVADHFSTVSPPKSLEETCNEQGGHVYQYDYAKDSVIECAWVFDEIKKD